MSSTKNPSVKPKSDVASERRITLADIAGEAGVSLATVSKVLNGRADVSATTRARVEQLLAGYGYLRRASGTTTGHARMVELVFHELESEWAIEIIRGVERVTREAGISLILTESGDRHSPGHAWIDGVLRRRPIGVILVFSDLGRPRRSTSSAAAASTSSSSTRPTSPRPTSPSIGSANWAGGFAAAQHLMSSGTGGSAMISGPEDMLCSVARVDGYRSALSAPGSPSNQSCCPPGDFHVARRPPGRRRGCSTSSAPDGDLRR